MCGIYLRVINGAMSKSLTDFDNLNFEQIKKRGPDEFVIHEDSDSKIVHGFARLAIRDIEGGNQPIVESRFVSAFNGEVYNTEDLKQVIKSERPNETLPESDTHLLGLWLFLFGPEKILEVIGMFAGYLQVGSKLYLFRDRVGEKPLYYGFYKNSFFVSSCLPKEVLNYEIISDFTLISGLVDYRISDKVFMVAPGTYIEIEIQKLFNSPIFFEKKYWVWPRRNRFMTKSNANSFEKKIINAVESQLVSEVGMSVLLSGGIDSGLVAAIARNAYGPGLESFTLAFNENSYNESSRAIKTAKHLSLKHEVISINFEELAENVDQSLESMDVPIFDSGALSLYSLCKKISSRQKVSLTGDGGDELFRGYSLFNHILSLNITSKIPLDLLFSTYFWLMESSLKKTESYLGSELKMKRAKSINLNRDTSLLFGAIGPLGGTELFNFICTQNNFKKFGNKGFMSKKSIEDYFVNEVLPKIYLVKSDRMSMCNGIELRSPLLDYRVIESAFGFSELSDLFKSRKHRIKSFANRLLPIEIVAGSKHGFSTPFHRVVRFLSMPDWKSPRNEVEYELFKRIWVDAQNGLESAGFPAWNLLVREHFFNRVYARTEN